MKKRTRGAVAIFCSLLVVTALILPATPADAGYLGDMHDLTYTQNWVLCAGSPVFLSDYHPGMYNVPGTAIIHADAASWPAFDPGLGGRCMPTGYAPGGNWACSYQGCSSVWPAYSTWVPAGTLHWFVCWEDSGGAQWDKLTFPDGRGDALVGYFPDWIVREYTRSWRHC
jgi:hypothetical protein